VLVDFPGFHWWLAWRAKRHGIPVVFYCPPQIWAWASWRIAKMRRLVDHVLSPLPFEHDWFGARGVPSTLVGHPFFDELATGVGTPEPAEVAAGHASQPLVLLLPGSRRQEIEGNLETLLRAAARIRARVPAARFAVGALHDRHARLIREVADVSAEARGLDIDVQAGCTRRLITEARAAIACSGSVSLELLAARVPAVIVYRLGGFAFVVQSWLRHARFITLVNLLASREPIGPVRPEWWPPAAVPRADPEAIYPEYLAVRDPSERVAEHVVEWIADPAARARVIERIEAVAAAVARPGSAARAAAAVIAIADRGEVRGLDTSGRHVTGRTAA
jgi:lipid-A-disaccharide synthase